MADLSSFVLLSIISAIVMIALIFGAIELYRNDLMAKGWMIFTVTMLLFIIGLMYFYFVYVLGPVAGI